MDIPEETGLAYHKTIQQIAATVLKHQKTLIMVDIISSDFKAPDFTEDQLSEVNMKMYNMFCELFGRNYLGSHDFVLKTRYYYIQDEEVRKKVFTDEM